MIAVFADIDVTLRRSAVGIVGGNVKGGSISAEVIAGNIDMNRLATEADVEAALLGLAGGGIGYVGRVVQIGEAFVRLVCQLLVQLRKIESKPRATSMVELGGLLIAFVLDPLVLVGVPVPLLFANQLHRSVSEIFAE